MKTEITIEKKIGYIIYGKTGCSCCSDEMDFFEGIFDTIEDAKHSKYYHRQNKTCASQYYECGIYDIYEIDYEELSDGRIIIGRTIFDEKKFYERVQYCNIDYDYKRIIE